VSLGALGFLGKKVFRFRIKRSGFRARGSESKVQSLELRV